MKDRIVQIMMVDYKDTDSYGVTTGPVLNGLVGLSARGKLYRLKFLRERLDVTPVDYRNVRRWEEVGEIGIDDVKNIMEK